ncbi:NAD(P)H-dependent oxidoreductase [Marinobacter hydrocarbonoclasticus]|nr:NAD(P)H-dependent oxidoreductase [Marinobacter nauticus]
MTTHTPHILAFSGSLRRDSWNHKLVEQAAERARAQGAEVTVIQLADYPLPLFNEELEGQPNPQLEALRQLFSSADGLLIASPEYNGSFTAALKNLLDWLSRPADGYTVPYSTLSAALLATSPGGLGGIRGLSHLRELLMNLGTLVMPGQLAVGGAFQAFNDAGQLANPAMVDRLDAIVAALVQQLSR